MEALRSTLDHETCFTTACNASFDGCQSIQPVFSCVSDRSRSFSPLGTDCRDAVGVLRVMSEYMWKEVSFGERERERERDGERTCVAFSEVAKPSSWIWDRDAFTRAII